jgi:hypothetical protein
MALECVLARLHQEDLLRRLLPQADTMRPAHLLFRLRQLRVQVRASRQTHLLLRLRRLLPQVRAGATVRTVHASEMRADRASRVRMRMQPVHAVQRHEENAGCHWLCQCRSGWWQPAELSTRFASRVTITSNE